MKFITPHFHFPSNDDFARRVVFYAYRLPDEPELEPDERKVKGLDKSLDDPEREELMKAIRNPLRFSLRDVKRLERYVRFNKTGEALDREERAQFNDMVAYFMGLTNHDFKALPERTLQSIYQNPFLQGFIAPALRDQVKLALDLKIESVSALPYKKVEELSPSDTVRLTQVYRYMDKEGVQKNDKLFLDIKDALIKKVSTDFIARLGEPMSRENLTPAEQLLLLEIIDMFPDREDWADYRTRKFVNYIAFGAAKDLLKADDRKNVDPVHQLSMEMLENVVYRRPDIFDKERMTLDEIEIASDGKISNKGPKDILERIEKATNAKTKELNALRFCSFLENKGTLPLLPVHYRALLALKEDTKETDLEKREFLRGEVEELDLTGVTDPDERKRIIDRFKKKQDDGEKENPGYQEVMTFVSTADEKVTKYLKTFHAGFVDRVQHARLTAADIDLYFCIIEKEKELPSQSSFHEDLKEELPRDKAKKKFLDKDKTKEKELPDRNAKEDLTVRLELLKVFRNQVEKVLEDIESSLGKTLADRGVTKLSSDNDKYRLFFVLDNLFSSAEIFKKADANVRSEIVGNAERVRIWEQMQTVEGMPPHVPQDFEAMVEGSVQYFQDRIRNEISSHFEITEDYVKKARENDVTLKDTEEWKIRKNIKDSALVEWERMHRDLRNSGAIEDENEAIIRYKAGIDAMNQKLENVRQYTSHLFETEKNNAPERRNALESEKKRILGEIKEEGPLRVIEKCPFEEAKNRFLYGEVDENGIFLPGVEVVEILQNQNTRFSRLVSEKVYPLLDEISSLRERAISVNAEKHKKIQEAEKVNVINGFNSMFSRVPLLLYTLEYAAENAEANCKRILPPEAQAFMTHYFHSIKSYIKHLRKKFDEFRALYEKKKAGNVLFNGDEIFFSDIPEEMEKLLYFLNFDEGFWAKYKGQCNERWENFQKGLDEVSDMGYFHYLPKNFEKEKKYKGAPYSAEEARQKFENIREEFQNDFQEFADTYGELQRIVLWDMNKFIGLTDLEFIEKYQVDKGKAFETLALGEEERLTEFRALAKDFSDKSFFENWLKKFQSGDENQVLEAIRQFAHWKEIKEMIQQAKEKTKETKKWLEKYEERQSERPSLFGSKALGHKVLGWNQVTWQRFSFYDLYAIVKQALESRDVYKKRLSDQAVGNLGTQFFGQNNSFGKEFRRRLEESEGQRVKEYESQYHDQPIWNIREAMGRSYDRDEIRACINLLQEKGAFMWDDPVLWKAMMHIQNVVTFDEAKDMKLSIKEIREKVRRAMSPVWTHELYRQWEQGYEDKHKKARDAFAAEFQSYEDDKNARTKIMATMLQKWKRGETQDVDPAKYELFISESFKNGKMNGQPDQRWYFLLVGATAKNPKTKQTLLSRDTIMRMNGEFLARFPHVDFFADKASWKKNGRIIPADPNDPDKAPVEGAHKQWDYDDYIAWGTFLQEGGDGEFDPRGGAAATQTKRFFYQFIHQSPFARDRAQRMQRFADKEGDHDDANSFFPEWTVNQAEEALNRRSEGTSKNSPDFWRTFLMGFDDYMKYTKEYIDNMDVEYRNHESVAARAGWQHERQRVLREVGSRIKLGLFVSQALRGNLISSVREYSMFADPQEWEKDTGYSPSLNKSKNNIDKVAKFILQEKGADPAVGQALDYLGAAVSTDKNVRQNHPEWTTNNALIAPITQTSKGDIYFQQDTAVIEKALGQYVSGGLG